ncbi:hypothetical protein [Candidatus Nesciobacter abundans]|uniref:Uncharacterized protein n=1 Tax=Candidatus Nesciobacter abundans TaxID=2601668 RepID=A0A5C0UHF9_9PROT|nr:hypothetical protein [Candidatus Nesciobacter abundans]QEK38993.1 hypothetical protein FZC36_00900 [Candidatus Nesciobacter abundans]
MRLYASVITVLLGMFCKNSFCMPQENKTNIQIESNSINTHRKTKENALNIPKYEDYLILLSYQPQTRSYCPTKDSSTTKRRFKRWNFNFFKRKTSCSKKSYKTQNNTNNSNPRFNPISEYKSDFESINQLKEHNISLHSLKNSFPFYSLIFPRKDKGFLAYIYSVSYFVKSRIKDFSCYWKSEYKQAMNVRSLISTDIYGLIKAVHFTKAMLKQHKSFPDIEAVKDNQDLKINQNPEEYSEEFKQNKSDIKNGIVHKTASFEKEEYENEHFSSCYRRSKAEKWLKDAEMWIKAYTEVRNAENHVRSKINENRINNDKTDNDNKTYNDLINKNKINSRMNYRVSKNNHEIKNQSEYTKNDNNKQLKIESRDK